MASKIKVVVICKGCGERIEIDDEYIPGLLGLETAAILYQPIGIRTLDLVNTAWQKTLACGNPDCQWTHTYTVSDLRLYDDEASN